MPLIRNSSYRPSIFMSNTHWQTVYPTLFRNINDVNYIRERISTPDNDFLDLDWSRIGSKKLIIISHGLEGDSYRPYTMGMARAFNRGGWDALAWNFRSCSGEINRQLRFYHSGAITDLDCVVQHVLKTTDYQRIDLAGFSMGGNLTLVYLGKMADRLDEKIVKAVTFSVPCDLKASSIELAKPRNRIYMHRFLNHLHAKVRAKMLLFPGQINDDNYHLIKNFKDYDDRYTAPIHGFKDAEDYWSRCGSLQYIPKIKIPALIVNALDDTFLTGDCYPYKEAADSEYVYLETPKHGGHVGFIRCNKDKLYWSEQRAVDFINQNQK